MAVYLCGVHLRRSDASDLLFHFYIYIYASTYLLPTPPAQYNSPPPYGGGLSSFTRPFSVSLPVPR